MIEEEKGTPDARGAVQKWLESEPLWRRAWDLLHQSGCRAYLVGGSVRDALWGHVGEDMDIAVESSAHRVGRWLADQLGGAFYPMDHGHDVARIIFRHGHKTLHIDLAGLRGRTIQEDLALRDFTVNAMGVALSKPLGPLLDPTGGQADLAAKVLRAAYPAAFQDDPIRILRALRLSATLGLRMDPETRRLIAEQRELVMRSSWERLRDELFMILAVDDSAPLLEAWELGVLPLLLPVSAEGFPIGVAWLESIRRWGNVDPHVGVSLERIRALWDHPWVEGRPRKCLVVLVALIGRLALEERRALGARLRLSGKEQTHLEKMFEALEANVWESRMPMSRIEAHRYYRYFGEGGLDAAAMMAHRPGASEAVRNKANYLLWAWFHAHEAIVAPPPLVSGDDLIHQCGLKPGPLIGDLLEAIAEAQVEGQVTTPAEALAFVQRVLSEKHPKGGAAECLQ